MRWWRRWVARRRWKRMAPRRYAIAKEAIDMGLAYGDPEYYRHACTVEEFTHLLNHIDVQAKEWLLKTDRERGSI